MPLHIFLGRNVLDNGCIFLSRGNSVWSGGFYCRDIVGRSSSPEHGTFHVWSYNQCPRSIFRVTGNEFKSIAECDGRLYVIGFTTWLFTVYTDDSGRRIQFSHHRRLNMIRMCIPHLINADSDNQCNHKYAHTSPVHADSPPYNLLLRIISKPWYKSSGLERRRTQFIWFQKIKLIYIHPHTIVFFF